MASYDDDGSSFGKQRSTAIWKVNFASNSVKYLTLEFTEIILYKARPHESSVIFLDSGRVMYFFSREETLSGKTFYPAKLVGAALQSGIERINFMCFPE